jgi:O-antigen ligase
MAHWRDAPAWLIFAIIAVAPFPFGAVSPVAIALLCCGAGLAVALFALRAPALPRPAIIGAAVLALILGYAAVVYLQVQPRTLDDALTHPIWRQAGGLLGTDLGGRATVVPDQPYLAVGAPLLTLLLLVGGYLCGADARLGRLLVQVIAWSGGVYALFGICSFAVAPTIVLWQQKIAYQSSLTGTFTNRNAAAVYFGSIAIVWLTLLFEAMDSRRARRGRRGQRRSTSMQKLRRMMVPSMLSFISMSAMLLTTSRAGVACSFIGVAIAFAIAFRKTISQRTRRWLIIGGAGFVLLMIYQLFDSGVGERLQTEGAAGGGRADVLWSIMRMIGEHPWLGTGLGTFRWSFAGYRSPDVTAWGVWDKAHNVLAEIAAEGGVMLAALVLLAWILAIAILMRSLAASPRAMPATRAALPVCAVALLHSLVDFSMQIPAYAMTVAALLGAGLAQALSRAEITTTPINFVTRVSVDTTTSH